MIVYHSPRYKSLAKNMIAYHKNMILGSMDSKKFPDGESYHRIENIKNIKQQDILLIFGTNDEDFLLLLETASTLVGEGANSLHIFIPFYSYSTQERQVKDGELVRAKTRAQLLSYIPQAHMGNTFYFFDLHTGGIPYYIEGSHQVEHIYGKNLIQDAIKEIKKTDKNPILVAPDAGRAKWVESLGKEFKLDVDFILKSRQGDKIDTSASNLGNFKNKTIIIYDDMIRSGNSIINACNQCIQHGCENIFLISSHGIFCDDALNKFNKIKQIKKIFVSDSYPQGETNKKLSVLPLTPLFSKYLEKNIKGEL